MQLPTLQGKQKSMIPSVFGLNRLLWEIPVLFEAHGPLYVHKHSANFALRVAWCWAGSEKLEFFGSFFLCRQLMLSLP